MKHSVAVLVLLAGAASAADPPPRAGRPLQVKEGAFVSPHGYVSSDACRSCHPKQYASWHASYHRTMTQVVTAETAIADFDNVTLKRAGRSWRLSRSDDGFHVSLPGGERRRLVQSTGSHHYQLYWYPSGRGRELHMLPFVFLRQERRWVPRTSVFLVPPAELDEHLVWNFQCLPCHSTDGRPTFRSAANPAEAVPESRVAELGIACEACHGPGAEHIRASSAESAPGSDTHIVHPGKLSAQRSAEVCGQCHSINVPYRPEDWIDWLLDGPTFRPGDALEDHRYLADAQTLDRSPLFRQWLDQGRNSLDEWFWSDGEVRVTGREFTALRRSPCFGGGDFSCLSCHSPHADDPDDLLTVPRETNQACAGCHVDLAANVAAHSHHPAGSAGALCVNCHMPNTIYGILKASRSHEITSPRVAAQLETGRPNACNLCHLDRSLGWSAERLADWYDQPAPELSAEQRATAAAPLGLLTGDAGQRALWAWHMGWSPAQAISGSGWLAPFLGRTLQDPYDVVRYIAERSLRTLPGHADFEYDFVEPRRVKIARPESAPDGVPIDRIDALLKRRDDRPMKLGE